MGLYADPIAERMPWHVDGTIFLTSDSGNTTYLQTSTTMQQMNDEDGSNVGERMTNAYGGYYIFLFPQLRDIAGYFWAQNSAGNGGTIQTSVNTTNGIDGTWTTQVASRVNVNGLATWRLGVQALSVTSVKAIRFSDNMGGGEAVHAIHIYGKRQAGTAPVDSLDIWHPTLDQPISATPALLDMAEVARLATATKTFRVKNLSSSKTANTVGVALVIETDAPVSLVGTIQFSFGGGAYANTASLGNLAAGAISGLVTVRYSPGASASLGPYVQRIVATAASFT
jgi:hypothetical protein